MPPKRAIFPLCCPERETAESWTKRTIRGTRWRMTGSSGPALALWRSFGGTPLQGTVKARHRRLLQRHQVNLSWMPRTTSRSRPHSCSVAKVSRLQLSWALRAATGSFPGRRFEHRCSDLPVRTLQDIERETWQSRSDDERARALKCLFNQRVIPRGGVNTTVHFRPLEDRPLPIISSEIVQRVRLVVL